MMRSRPSDEADSSIKLPACEPCREAKVACNHAQPVCIRCQKRQQEEKCFYRARPFKKRKTSASDDPNLSGSKNSPKPWAGVAADAQQSPASPSTNVVHPNPNPNFLGPSSYTTIFSRMTSDTDAQSIPVGASDEELLVVPGTNGTSERHISEQVIRIGVNLLKAMKASGIFPGCVKFMDQWFSRGSNGALMFEFSQECVQATSELVSKVGNNSITDLSKRLSIASSSPQDSQAGIKDYSRSLCGVNICWETLGLCFAMLPRATNCDYTHDDLGKDEYELHQLRNTTMSISDQCLEIALSLDCLNDLQLFVQYENFITHAHVDGNQSYTSWRKIGDVISSIYALGYHEDVIGKPAAPIWRQQMRKAAVARIYSADKNVAIFLGRPPRINRRFFSTKVLGHIAVDLTSDNCSKEAWHLPVFDSTTFSYQLDTWWSAVCARLKEEALDLSREGDTTEQLRKAGIIEAHSQAQWASLASRYRLTGSIKTCSSNPQERDFIVAAKLNHLHVLFITKIALARFDPKMSHELVSTSALMLSLVSEAILLRSFLHNSGTTLLWKVIYYGLPAAGIVCLYLLSSNGPGFVNVSKAEALQNLNVLVAHILSKAFIDIDDPNFALLDSAGKAIQAIIGRLFSQSFRSTNTDSDALDTEVQAMEAFDNAWLAWDDLQFQDFEASFWQNISEHPALG